MHDGVIDPQISMSNMKQIKYHIASKLKYQSYYQAS